MRRILHLIGLAIILICNGAVAASRAADEWDQGQKELRRLPATTRGGEGAS